MANETILAPHRSIRTFRPEPLPDGMLRRLVAEAQHAPTDATAQLYSFVRIAERGLRQRIAVLAGNQEHIGTAAEFMVVCADVRRVARLLARRGATPGSVPATGLHFAIVDSALAAQRLIDAAESVGLGTVCVGGIVNGIEELVDMLALPVGVLPLFGLCLGLPDEEPPVRPRIAVESVLHTDRYRDQASAEIDADMEAMAGVTRRGDWLAVLARYFAAGGVMEEREPALHRVLERQGFAWKGV